MFSSEFKYTRLNMIRFVIKHTMKYYIPQHDRYGEFDPLANCITFSYHLSLITLLSRYHNHSIIITLNVFFTHRLPLAQINKLEL